MDRTGKDREGVKEREGKREIEAGGLKAKVCIENH
jgi:hypothetical protein